MENFERKVLSELIAVNEVAEKFVSGLFWVSITTGIFLVVTYISLRIWNEWSSGEVIPYRLTALWKKSTFPPWSQSFPGILPRAFFTTLFGGSFLALIIFAVLSNAFYLKTIGWITTAIAVLTFLYKVQYWIFSYGYTFVLSILVGTFSVLWSVLTALNLTPFAIWEAFLQFKTEIFLLSEALFELDGSSEPTKFWTWLYLWSAYFCVEAIDFFYAVVNFSICNLFSKISGSISYGLVLSGAVYLLALFLLIHGLRAIHLVLKKIWPNGYGTVYSFLTWEPTIWAYFVALGIYPPIRNFLKEQLSYSVSRPYLFTFTVLAVFKAVKLVVQLFSYNYWTQPSETPIAPTVTARDVTVVVTATGDFGDEFKQCIKSILNNYPAQIIVELVGNVDQYNRAMSVCQALDPTIYVAATYTPNKREELINLYNLVQTSIICLANDHVFWPSSFLRSSLAEFEDPVVGLVGTPKRVIRDRSGSLIDSFRNYLASIYLERENFENTASHNIDGGVSVISDLTALVRTKIVQSYEYRQSFLNETLLWGKVGPMKADHDNFTTRFMVNHGYKTVFRNEKHAIISTTLGLTDGSTKFSDQLLRWARATWRSNGASLFTERKCWRATPWTTYAIFISSFFNLALIYDPLLAYTLYVATGTEYLGIFFLLLFFSKLIKPFPHLKRHPKDIVFVFGGIVFGYYHSWVRIKALFSILNVA